MEDYKSDDDMVEVRIMGRLTWVSKKELAKQKEKKKGYTDEKL